MNSPDPPLTLTLGCPSFGSGSIPIQRPNRRGTILTRVNLPPYKRSPHFRQTVCLSVYFPDPSVYSRFPDRSQKISSTVYSRDHDRKHRRIGTRLLFPMKLLMIIVSSKPSTFKGVIMLILLPYQEMVHTLWQNPGPLLPRGEEENQGRAESSRQ